MQPNHSKACMIEFLRSRSTKAYKRKAMQNTEVTVLEPADMDIDDESDDGKNFFLNFYMKFCDVWFSFSEVKNMPLGERVAQLQGTSSLLTKVSASLTERDQSTSVTVITLESQSPLSDGEIVENDIKREDSPSLDDLNERKKRLLSALDDSTLSITTLEKKQSSDDSLIEDILALQDDSILESSGINDESDSSKCNLNSQSISESPPSTPRNNLVKKIGVSPLHSSKATVRGTPVIQGISPYNNLPNCEKWATGVTDMLDFENLPESVGKYEKMRTLLGKVRAEVKKIQYEDENEER